VTQASDAISADARGKLFTAVLSDVLDELGYRQQAMPPRIRPLDASRSFIGRARTGLYMDVFHVTAGANPYEMEMDLVDGLCPGDVAVLACGGSQRIVAWGELLTTAAQVRGAVACVTDGHVRDTQRIAAMSFPVFHAGISPTDSKGRGEIKSIDVPIECAGVRVDPGDLILGDADGVVVVPRLVEQSAVGKALAKIAGEDATRDELLRGVKLREVFARRGIL